jgi:L,D-transpeptidase ErfK/SrfK
MDDEGKLFLFLSESGKTLGKAYSNGCVGTSEQDAWRLYFYAPIGTKVVIRYDRLVINSTGDSTLLPHIYDKNNFKLRN